MGDVPTRKAELTLTLFRFAPAPPDLVRTLPEIDAWDYPTRLLLSSDEARLAYRSDQSKF